eukprot:1195942-Ditylum_brightwellii.AAC.1
MGGTATNRDVVYKIYLKEKKTFKEHSIVDKIFKNVLVTAVNKAFLDELKYENTKYLGITTRDMLDHLLD